MGPEVPRGRGPPIRVLCGRDPRPAAPIASGLTLAAALDALGWVARGELLRGPLAILGGGMSTEQAGMARSQGPSPPDRAAFGTSMLGGAERTPRRGRSSFSLAEPSRPSVRTICPVLEKRWETPSTVTLRFSYLPSARPGQFVMIWVPGDDELPMSLSYTDGALKGVTIKAMGETSRRILSLEQGTPVGIRGPYGNTFDVSPKRILVVAGGSGGAVLAPAAEEARRRGGSVGVALGATSEQELLFRERFDRMADLGLRIATDDGSVGHRGYVTEVAAHWLREGRFDALWTCGPEVMMVKLVRSARETGVPIFCSVEREMKCAIAMCDACAFGPYHVCADGPVFSGERLHEVPDFGNFKRDPSGRRVKA